MKDVLGPKAYALVVADIFDDMQARWSPALTLRLMQKCSLTNRQALSLKRLLSMEVDDQGEWRRCTVAGMPVPKLASRHAVGKLKKKMLQDIGFLPCSTKNGAASVSLTKTVVTALGAYDRLHGFFPDETVRLQWVMDKANLLRSVGQVGAGVRLPDHSVHPANAPLSQLTVTVFEAQKETYTVVGEQCARPLAEFNNLQGYQYPCLAGGHANIKLCAGGDDPSLDALYGTVGAGSLYPCKYCDAPKKDLMCTEQKEEWEPRTIKTSNLRAHAVCGTCPDCGLKLTKANLLDAHNLTMNDTACKKHARLHHGQKPGEKVQVDVEHAEAVPCFLHGILTCTKHMMASTLWKYMNDVKSKGGAPTQAEKVMDLFSARGKVHISKSYVDANKSKAGGAKVYSAHTSILKHTFPGAECAWIRDAYITDLLAIMHPPDTNSAQTEIHGLYTGLWAKWKLFIDTAFEEEPPEDTPQTRRTRAAAVFKAGVEWMKMFKQLNCSATALYPHVLVFHLSQRIITHGFDLMAFSGEGMEHENKFRKKHMRGFNSMRPISRNNETMAATALHTQTGLSESAGVMVSVIASNKRKQVTNSNGVKRAKEEQRGVCLGEKRA